MCPEVVCTEQIVPILESGLYSAVNYIIYKTFFNTKLTFSVICNFVVVRAKTAANNLIIEFHLIFYVNLIFSLE